MRLSGWRAGIEPDFIAGDTSQTTVKHLSAKQVNGILIPLPSLEEQRCIVEKADELMAVCDDLEARQQRREQSRDRLVASTLHHLTSSASADDETAGPFGTTARFYLDNLAKLTTRPEHVKQLREAILDLAVRGKLVPQDPNDEPADKLLKRVAGSSRRPTIRDSVMSADDSLPSEELFPIPSTWRWDRLGALIQSADSGTSPKAESFPRSGGAWGVVKVSAVSWGEFRPEENKQLLPNAKVPASARIDAGDFLISRANTSELVAKCVVVREQPQNLIMSDKIVRLRFTPACVPRFIAIINNHAPYARSYYATRASGTSYSMKNVSRSVIYSLPIPLPPVDEQRRMVAKVDKLIAVCDELEHGLSRSSAAAAHFVDRALHRTLSDTSHIVEPRESIAVR